MARTERVVVAMSGGVDSSLAAALLIAEGYAAVGVTIKLAQAEGCRSTDSRSRCSFSGIESARRMAGKLGIPFYVLDLSGEFERVIDYFCREYARGRTPNPCIKCNEWIKLGSLLNWARGLNARYVATGHYVRVVYSKKKKKFLLLQGLDRKKDQSYVLFSLKQRQLASLLTPLGKYRKEEVRQMARRRGLAVYDRPESQEICFIPRGDYRRIVRQRLEEKIRPGLIKTGKGEILGRHDGVAYYTIGQRRGLGIATGRPRYVVRIDSEDNDVVVGSASEGKGKVLIAEHLNWIDRKGISRTLKAEAKIRYGHPRAACRITACGANAVRVEFDSAQQFITPGQAVVFYQQDRVLGGGWIREQVE